MESSKDFDDIFCKEAKTIIVVYLWLNSLIVYRMSGPTTTMTSSGAAGAIGAHNVITQTEELEMLRCLKGHVIKVI